MQAMAKQILLSLAGAWRPLIAATVLFSLFFSFEGGLRWLGLFGVVPVVLYWAGCASCGRSHDGAPWPMP